MIIEPGSDRSASRKMGEPSGVSGGMAGNHHAWSSSASPAPTCSAMAKKSPVLSGLPKLQSSVSASDWYLRRFSPSWSKPPTAKMTPPRAAIRFCLPCCSTTTPVTRSPSSTSSLIGLCIQMSTPARRAPAVRPAASAFPPATISFLISLPPVPWRTRCMIVGERPQRPTRHQVHDPEIPTCDGHRNRRGNRFARAEDRGAAFDAVGVERLGLDRPADGGSAREVGKVVRILVHVAELERRGGQNLVGHGGGRFGGGLGALAGSRVGHEVVQVGHYALLGVDRGGLPPESRTGA